MDDSQKKQTGDASEIEQMKKEREEYLNGWKRAKADLINYQKEESRRLEEAVAYANASLVRDLTSLIDSFELALHVLPAEDASKKGLAVIANQFEDILRRHNAVKIVAAKGDVFNPTVHEAVGEVELSPEQKNWDGKIAEVLSIGYQLNNRVIRPARVKIGKSSSSL